jgi:endonuclease/exonuclease/phosphatase family metal-dependent hydrolase
LTVAVKLRVATYNIHKGVMRAPWSVRPASTIHALRQAMQLWHRDLLFLQEVQGEHQRYAKQLDQWPRHAQHEFLAQTPGADSYYHAYGKSAVYLHGHHGNAILSRFPIIASEHRDMSDHVLEKRGVLHVQVKLPVGSTSSQSVLHCFVVHFGLLASGRKRQVEALTDWVQSVVPLQAPLIIAGDFNDWNNRLHQPLCEPIALAEVHEQAARPAAGTGFRAARTFPAWLPWLRMDRIYQRGFRVEQTRVLKGRAWAKLSDHSPLLADLIFEPGLG